MCLDLSAGSGTALSHQYDQGQVSALISYCNGTLYGTGDIHPPEPPRTPEHEAQVKVLSIIDHKLPRMINPSVTYPLTRSSAVKTGNDTGPEFLQFILPAPD